MATPAVFAFNEGYLILEHTIILKSGAIATGYVNIPDKDVSLRPANNIPQDCQITYKRLENSDKIQIDVTNMSKHNIKVPSGIVSSIVKTPPLALPPSSPTPSEQHNCTSSSSSGVVVTEEVTKKPKSKKRKMVSSTTSETQVVPVAQQQMVPVAQQQQMQMVPAQVQTDQFPSTQIRIYSQEQITYTLRQVNFAIKDLQNVCQNMVNISNILSGAPDGFIGKIDSGEYQLYCV